MACVCFMTLGNQLGDLKAGRCHHLKASLGLEDRLPEWLPHMARKLVPLPAAVSAGLLKWLRAWQLASPKAGHLGDQGRGRTKSFRTSLQKLHAIISAVSY